MPTLDEMRAEAQQTYDRRVARAKQELELTLMLLDKEADKPKPTKKGN